MTEVSLLGPVEIRRLAEQTGVRPSKQRGQNFVVDANTIRRIVRLAELDPADVVLEVGPGLGSLTLGILEVTPSLTAIEIEPSFAQTLPDTVARQTADREVELRVVERDALQVTELPGPNPTKLVANLPYNVSVPVLLNLLQRFDSISAGLVMVQLEVADRLVAKPGSKAYGAPSAKLAWYADSSRVGTVPASVFWPVPNVESGLVSFRRHQNQPEVSRQAVFAVIDAAFGQRRKMLRAALAGLFGGGSAASEAILAAGIDPQIRGEMLAVADFARIAARLP